MLRLILEIVPFGLESARRELGRVEIANVGGFDKTGKYEAKCFFEKEFVKLEGIKHNRADKAWKLVHIVIGRILRERRKSGK